MDLDVPAATSSSEDITTDVNEGSSSAKASSVSVLQNLRHPLIVLPPLEGRVQVSWYSSSSKAGTKECQSSSTDENQRSRSVCCLVLQ